MWQPGIGGALLIGPTYSSLPASSRITATPSGTSSFLDTLNIFSLRSFISCSSSQNTPQIWMPREVRRRVHRTRHDRRGSSRRCQNYPSSFYAPQSSRSFRVGCIGSFLSPAYSGVACDAVGTQRLDVDGGEAAEELRASLLRRRRRRRHLLQHEVNVC